MTVCSYSLKKIFSLKLFWIFSFKIDCITLDPDPNSMYLDPQHWLVHSLPVVPPWGSVWIHWRSGPARTWPCSQTTACCPSSQPEQMGVIIVRSYFFQGLRFLIPSAAEFLHQWQTESRSAFSPQQGRFKKYFLLCCCCGSGMIYSGSGLVFSVFRI